MNIAGVEIGAGQPCRFVAEISNNHNGDLALAISLIHQAREAGADFVKFQCYTPAELVALRGDGPAPEPWGSQGWTMASLYERARTPLQWWPALVEECRQVGIPWFSSVFGNGSLAILEAFDCPAYKLASLDHGKRSLYRMVKAIGKPMLRSLPDAKAPRKTDDLTLYCPAGYPQSDFSGLRSAFPGHIGFSFHGTLSARPYDAAVLDAKLIECHVQDDNTRSELEAGASLTMGDFRSLIQAVRIMEEALR